MAEHRLTIKQRKFIDNLFLGMTQAEAYLAAGYKAKNRHVASSAANRLLKKVDIKAAIDDREAGVIAGIKRRLHAEADKSLNKVFELRDRASVPADITKLKAAQDTLDRLGIKPPERTDVSGTMHFVIEHVKRDDS